jgi:lipoprotein-anchoring transpeptidase ErfK/SrfK
MQRNMRIALIAAAALVGAAGVMPGPASAETRYYDHASNSWRDAAAAPSRRMSQSMRKPARQFMRTKVSIATNEAPGTIIVDSERKYLYYVEGRGRATRYGVGVGREGFGWSGDMKVGRKAEWPGWTPPKEMIAREKAVGRIIPAYMEGGPNNPLGAAALYLYRNGRDSIFRIHGTNQPWTIGQNMSSGCIRMMNEDVQELYARAGTGTKVIVIGPDGRGREGVYREAGLAASGQNILGALFGG